MILFLVCPDGSSHASTTSVKRDHLLEDTHLHLRRSPEAPRHLNWVVVTVGHVPEHWEQYLGPAA